MTVPRSLRRRNVFFLSLLAAVVVFSLFAFAHTSTHQRTSSAKSHSDDYGAFQDPIVITPPLPKIPGTPTETQLKILTLNCWDLKFVSQDRAARINGIANVLLSRDHDIVSLQELWVYSDYERVKAAVSGRLPYSIFFFSGAVGSGLAFFSRFPFIETSINPYSLNGEPTDVLAGDWFAGKAAVSIVIMHPVLGELEVFNTHLYAKGGDYGLVYERAHRLVGAWELAKLVRQSSAKGRFVVAAGDFNSVPSTVPLTIIRDHGGLSDSWLDLHPDTCKPPEPADEDWPGDEAGGLTRAALEVLVHRYGITADTPLNSYTASKLIDGQTMTFGGKRLDYIMYRQPVRPSWATHSQLMALPELRPVESNVVLTESVPGFEFSYSDHFGLETTFEFSPAGSYFMPLVHANCNHTKVFLASGPPNGGLSVDDTEQAITNLMIRYDYAEHRSNGELKVFGLCVLLLLGLLLGATQVSGSWLNLLLVVLTIYMAWLATTLLYEGFLFGNWEMRILRNVIAEMELHRSRMPY